MKVLAAFPCAVAAVDDSSTLLSLKVQTTLETGVDHLLDAVGSRNVTQMSSLLQNLVEETISEGPYELDGDVTAALDVIKRELLGDIRGALKESHCYDQADLHNQMFCFADCEAARKKGHESCGKPCDGMAHKDCRMGLLELYKVHINECRALDNFVWDFSTYKCPMPPKKCCLLSHTTWNCEGLCSGSIAKLEVDASFGLWLSGEIAKFTAAHAEWLRLHKKCTAAYEEYVMKDAKCDCEQARCETDNCAYDTCHFMNCEDAYQSCWARCQGEWEEIRKEKECLEKDRKIDWSATEKIECYVNVLLEKPTPAELLAECGSETCYNVYREHMYKKCNEICVEVDFTNEKAELRDHERLEHIEGTYVNKKTDVKDQTTHQGADQDVTAEGKHSVRTMHRGEGDDKRCTSHLDIDYLEQPCCQPCEERPSRPCEDDVGAYTEGANTYMWFHYHQYGFYSKADVVDFTNDICYEGMEHTQVYAYNLCPCLDCELNPPPPPQVCTYANGCGAYGSYDYSKHTVVVNCNDISKSNPTYGGAEEA